MSQFTLPDQSIPESKKDKDWHMLHAIDYANFSVSDNYNDQREEMLKLYRAYNAELSEEELELAKTVTCPNGISLGQEFIVYPLIQTKVEQIVGEYMTRPLRRKAYVTDKLSKNKKYEEKLSMLSEEFARQVTENVSQNLGFTPETKNPEMQIPEDIEEHDFKTVAEEVADSLIRLFLDVRKEKQKFKNLFTHYCITDRAHAVVDKKHGFTTMRNVHPLDADYDIDPYKTVQDNHEYFFENYYLTENEIYNTFDLSKSDKAKVKNFFEGINGMDDSTSFQSQELGTSQKYNGWFQTSNKVHRLRMINCVWKSRKKVRIKESQGKNKTFYKKMNEDDKRRKKDNITTIDGEMPRHCIMLGPEICLSFGLLEERFSSIDDPFSCYLNIVSVIRENTVGTSLIKSVASKLYQLQTMASEVLFEIRLALKSAGDSRVLVYDSSQTPKEFTKEGYESGLNRVMHHIKKDKLMIINSKQKGMNSSFNQFTSLDLSQKGAVQDLFNGLAIIEDLASKFVGISPEREGQVGQYQTATGTDKALQGSFARTEIIFTPFDEFIQVILERVLLRGKYDYEKGEVIQYIFGEMKTKFLTLFDDFFASDFGIYLSDSRKDKEAAERIDRAAEMSLSNAQAPEIIMGLIDVFNQDNAVDKRKVFQDMLDSIKELSDQRQAQEKEMNDANIQAQQARQAEDDKLKREGYQKDIKVAEIYVEGKGMDRSLDNKSKELIKKAELDVARETAAQQSSSKEE